MSGFSSMFSQLLKLFPRTEFQALVKRTHAERHARGFTCWGQFVAGVGDIKAHYRKLSPFSSPRDGADRASHQ